MTEEHKKLDRIIVTRMKFMRMPWTRYTVEILKTKVRITFYSDTYTKGSKDDICDSRTTEYALTGRFTMDDVIADQQRKLGRDVIQFVGKENMDELLEVLV